MQTTKIVRISNTYIGAPQADDKNTQVSHLSIGITCETLCVARWCDFILQVKFMGNAFGTCFPWLHRRTSVASTATSQPQLSAFCGDNNCDNQSQLSLSLPYVIEQQVQPAQSEVFTVVIEGNISCGKSELLSFCERKYGEGFSIVYEPVNVWQDFGEHNINYLAKFYENPKKYAFLFQNVVQFTRMRIYAEKDRTIKPVCLLERGLESVTSVFSQVLYDEGKLSREEYLFLNEQYETYSKLYNTKKIPIIYLRADPLVCFERIRKRARPEERNISIDYLRKLHGYYDKWLLHNSQLNLIVIDGNKPLAEVCEYFDREIFPAITGAANIYYNQ
jgi:deoxyadenosine/deoxycytidine kinase